MDSTIQTRTERLKDAITLLVQRLRDSGYVFARPADVLPGAESKVESNIRRIENEIGTVPQAIATFWRCIGSVDFCGHHSAWTGCEYPDPLVILPSAAAIAELDEFVADKEERLKCNLPFLIPIAPDHYHKENVSGGMWYNIECPAVSDDPIVHDEGRDLPFLDYVEMALSWGGFPGLEHSPRHTWPIDQLAVGLLPPG